MARSDAIPSAIKMLVEATKKDGREHGIFICEDDGKLRASTKCRGKSAMEMQVDFASCGCELEERTFAFLHTHPHDWCALSKHDMLAAIHRDVPVCAIGMRDGDMMCMDNPRQIKFVDDPVTHRKKQIHKMSEDMQEWATKAIERSMLFHFIEYQKDIDDYSVADIVVPNNNLPWNSGFCKLLGAVRD